MKIKVIEAVEIYSATPERLGKKDALITYSVDEVGIYMVTLPAEEATEDKIKEAITKAETARQKLIGKEFEV